MSVSSSLLRKLNFLQNTLCFFQQHFAVLFGLGLIAAFGRVFQLGGFGAITHSIHIMLEIIIEAARLCLFLYVLGLANVKKGLLRVKRFFTQKTERKVQWALALHNLKKGWPAILLNIAGFLLIAWVLNSLIDLLAYETCLYLTLKQDGILAASSSEWTILLFFKNLSVIPFTLVFEALLLLWVTNKLSSCSLVSTAQ